MYRLQTYYVSDIRDTNRTVVIDHAHNTQIVTIFCRNLVCLSDAVSGLVSAATLHWSRALP